MPVSPKKITVRDGERSAEISDPQELLANLVDSIPAFVWTAGPSKECTYFNRAWLDYRELELELEQELIDGFTYGIHPDDTEHTINEYLRAFDCRTLYQTEYRIQNSQGEYRWVLDRGMPVYRPEDDEFLGYAGTCTDIHERKELEEELQ